MKGKPCCCHSRNCPFANVHVIAIIDLTLHNVTQRDNCMYSMFVRYFCCLMFRCLLLGVRLMYKDKSQRSYYIRISIMLCFHYHPCTADVPLLAATFQNGEPDIARHCLKHHICVPLKSMAYLHASLNA